MEQLVLFLRRGRITFLHSVDESNVASKMPKAASVFLQQGSKRVLASCRRSSRPQQASTTSQWQAGKVERRQAGRAWEAWELQSQPQFSCNRAHLSQLLWQGRVAPTEAITMNQAQVAGASALSTPQVLLHQLLLQVQDRFCQI